MRASNKKALAAAVAMAMSGIGIASRHAYAANGTDTWVGNTSGNWADANWSGVNNPPITGDAIEFGAAGTSGTTLVDNLMTAATFTLSAINFDTGAAAFTINPLTTGTVNPNGFTLASGTITDNAANTETITDPITYTGNQNFTFANSGTLVVGAINDTSGGLTLTGAGTLRASGAPATNSGLLTLNSGTTLLTTQDFHCGGLTGSGNVSDPTTSDKWFFVTNALAGNTETYSGAITGGASKLGFNYTGLGTLIMTGANQIDDAVNVNSGKVVFSGGHNNTTQGDGVGEVANANGILILPSTGTFSSNDNTGQPYNSSMAIATTANASGDLQNPGSTFIVNRQLAVGGSGYGAFTQTAGSTSVGGFLAVGGTINGGVVNLQGGTFTFTTSPASGATSGAMTIGFGGSNGGTIGNLNVSGNAQLIDNAANSGFGGGLWLGEVNNGILNMTGNAVVTISPAGSHTSGGGVVLGRSNATTGNGIVDLDGGTLTAPYVTKGSGQGTFNFNGGTLKANASDAVFMTGLTNAYIYGGGATIDDGGNNITIGQSLQAPSGSSVSATGLTVSGGGYIDTPVVNITGGGGTGAEAVATIDSNGNLTGINITNPGTGYTSAPTFALIGGGVGNTGSIGGTATLVSATSGGLTKQGAGSVTLTGTSTYTGATTVNAGSLVLGSTGSINGSSAINFSGGGKFLDISTTAVTPTVTITSGTLDGIGTLTTAVIADSASNVLTSGNGSTGQLVIGSLTLSGAATFNARTAAALMSTPAVLATTFTDSAVAGKKITVNAATTDPSWALGTYDLLGYTTLGSGNGFSDFQLGTVTGLTARQTASLSFSAGTTNEIALTVTGISGSDIWTGLNNGNWTTTVQTPNKNWTLNSSPTDFIAGDIVTFDDSATGTTNVSITDATVTPTSVTFNNSAKSYTIAGAGAIAGSTGVTVMGTGNVTISTNNTYTGGTTVNAGNLVLSGNNNFGAGSVTVSGGTATISGSNTYSGGTVLNSGVLNINNANALGSGTLTIAGGTIDTTAGALSLSTNNPQAWNGSFAFNGTNALNLGTGAVTLGGNTTVTTTANTLTVGGAIGDGGHGFALTKAGLGTLTLTGTSTYSGGTNVSGGTLVVTSTGSLTGSVNNPGVLVGGTSGVVGALVNSGTITDSQEMWLATADGGYGALTLTTGTITVGSWLALARGGGNAVLNVNGGTLNVTGANMTLGSFGGSTTDLHAVATFNAGSINVTNAVYVGEGTNAVLTVTGTAALTAGSIRPALGNFYGNPTGIFNLEGGTVTTGSLTAGGGAATANFNGGTLKASANSAAFMAGMANAYIWSGGLTLDDQGHSITMSQALSSPTGNGVTGNGLSASGTGYIAPPVVVVSGGGGTGATATANIDANGNLTGINITNPGVGYTSAPTFTLEGGGGAGSVTGSAALAANVGGGFTKMGAGTVTISGTSTYTGLTTITAGTLALPAQTTPLPVALYTFNNVTDSSNNPVATGTLAAGDIVVNSGSGGAALNGTVNIADSLSGMSGVVLSNSSPNKFGGNYANFDGTGTSIDVPSQIVDQSGAGNWTMSTWMQTNIAGSAFLSKNTGGSATGWVPGNSVFYLGSNPPSGTPGNLPTGVQNSGGFLQGNSNVADNNWHMVTFVDNGGSKSIYVDGVAVALSSSAFNNADVSNFVRIGFNVDTLSNLDGNINFAGNLTDLSFYGSALNSAQVTQLFNTNTVGTVNLQYLPAATPVNITTSGAALNINGQLQSIGSLAGVAGSQVMLGNGLLKVGGVSGSTTFAGTVTGTGILQLNGPGTLALSGANTYTGGTSVTGGLLQILSTGTPGVSALADGPVSISGGKLQLGTSTGLATITSLAISGTGTFDISNNHVIINYGSGTDPIASIAALLATGYAGGAWNGAGGITSSAVATNPGYGVGYADAADAGNPAGLASGTIEVKFTLLGDADLNGVVNGIDFGILAANFNKGVTGWDKGDFDYNNVVNGIDFGALAANFNKGAAGASGGASAGDWAALEQFAAANGLLADVPEPATLGLLAVAAVSTLSRRRRRRA